jgi:hypothetical protein
MKSSPILQKARLIEEPKLPSNSRLGTGNKRRRDRDGALHEILAPLLRCPKEVECRKSLDANTLTR